MTDRCIGCGSEAGDDAVYGANFEADERSGEVAVSFDNGPYCSLDCFHGDPQ